MSTHTEGPWVVDLSTEGRIYVAQKYGDGPGGRICEVFQNCLVRGNTQAVNADLLAAAPDLLEALKDAFRLLMRNDIPEDEQIQIVVRVRNAMEKATGAA